MIKAQIRQMTQLYNLKVEYLNHRDYQEIESYFESVAES